MRLIFSLLITLLLLAGCSGSTDFNAAEYFHHINQAELAISNENYETALNRYNAAFNNIEKPFGKDIFNAALAGQLAKNYQARDVYLQKIIDNSEDPEFVKSVFVGTYISGQEWENLVAKREVEYDQELRAELKEMYSRDQLFRPMYGTHDDTINAIRKRNMEKIIEITDSRGFPSHIELGYSKTFWNQPHDIVLHHTAQRRSYDKSVTDLEPILKSAVEAGRFDPELAIFYLNFQNDMEKDYFEVYSSWQHKHHLLPDSLNNKVWYINLTNEQQLQANKTREKWYANSIDEIAVKAKYLQETELPFVFSSVRKSIGYMKEEYDKEKALEQYHLQTMYKIEQ